MKQNSHRYPQMKFRNLHAYILTLLFIACSAVQPKAADLNIEAAPIGFPNPSISPATLVEFSYSVHADELTFLPDSVSGGYLAGIYANVILFDSQNLPIDSSSQVFATRSPDARDSAMVIANRLRMIVQPGKYSAKLVVQDITSKNSGTHFFRISVDKSDSKKLLISGVEMAHALTSVGPDTTGNSLIKNGWQVFPNPLGAYSTNDTLIKLYAEIYNIQPDSAGKYHIGARVELRAAGEEIPAILSEVYWEVQGSSIVFARSLEHTATVTGPHILNLIITDPAAGISDTSSRHLYFQNPDQPEEAIALGVTSYDTTSLEAREQMVFWLLTPRERDFMKGLTNSGKQQYIVQFWLDNGDSPTVGRTAFRDDVQKRYNYAMNKYSFTSESGDGWRRDPGRVLMQYGFPDEIIDMPMPSIENDITAESGWERWNYDRVQGGVYFIFANEYGYSDFQLKHSNAQGETFDSGIEDQINQLFRQSGG